MPSISPRNLAWRPQKHLDEELTADQNPDLPMQLPKNERAHDEHAERSKLIKWCVGNKHPYLIFGLKSKWNRIVLSFFRKLTSTMC